MSEKSSEKVTKEEDKNKLARTNMNKQGKANVIGGNEASMHKNKLFQFRL